MCAVASLLLGLELGPDPGPDPGPELLGGFALSGVPPRSLLPGRGAVGPVFGPVFGPVLPVLPVVLVWAKNASIFAVSSLAPVYISSSVDQFISCSVDKFIS